MEENILTGKVLYCALETNQEIITSSKEIRNANNEPETMEGINKGIVTLNRTVIFPAPMMVAACSSAGSMFFMPAWEVTIMKGKVATTWAHIRRSMPWLRLIWT